jgi:hypothetical protein
VKRLYRGLTVGLLFSAILASAIALADGPGPATIGAFQALIQFFKLPIQVNNPVAGQALIVNPTGTAWVNGAGGGGGGGVTSISATLPLSASASTGAVNLSIVDPLTVQYGGTGLSSYTTGDLLTASSSSALAQLHDVALGSVLASQGVGVEPAYVSIGSITSGVTLSQVLANGNTTGTKNMVFTTGTGLAFNSGSPSANTISFANGGGSVVQIKGPTDQELNIESSASTSLGLNGAQIIFSTTAGLATSQIFDGFDNSVLAATGSALATTATDGFTYLPFCAGTPTGTPAHLASVYAGAIPLVVDTSGTPALYGYIGGAWTSLTGSGGGALTLNQVLTNGNTTSGKNIVLSGGDDAIIFSGGSNSITNNSNATRIVIGDAYAAGIVLLSTAGASPYSVTIGGSGLSNPTTWNCSGINDFGVQPYVTFAPNWRDGGAATTVVPQALVINPTANFTGASTGHYEALTINVVETNLPSGTADYLVRGQTGTSGGNDVFLVDRGGNISFAETVVGGTGTQVASRLSWSSTSSASGSVDTSFSRFTAGLACSFTSGTISYANLGGLGGQYVNAYSTTLDIVKAQLYGGAGGSGTGLSLGSDSKVSWATGTDATGSIDLALTRVSANLLGVGTTTTTGDVTGSMKFTNLSLVGSVPLFKNVSTAGFGVPATYAAANITAQTAAASIASYGGPVGADGTFEVSASVNVTAATAISTSVQVTYTDASNTARTTVLPVQLSGGTGGTFLTNGLIITTGDYSTPVVTIRCHVGTTITVQTSAGTFSGVTYSAAGTIKQIS